MGGKIVEKNLATPSVGQDAGVSARIEDLAYNRRSPIVYVDGVNIVEHSIGGCPVLEVARQDFLRPRGDQL